MRSRRLHRRALAVVAAALAGAIALAGCAPDRPDVAAAPDQVQGDLPADTLTALQSAVNDAMAATGSSGAIVGVWVPWSGTWVAGVGTQTPGDQTPVRADMRFRVGDVTRAMTCDALYILAGDGVLKLDDPVSKYVAGVPDLKDVTLVQLCDGTSGIGSYQPQLEGAWIANPGREWDPRELASFGLGQARTGQPGAAWSDSDAGYVLLGLALERASGKDASTILSDDVFDPLGLSSTSLPPEGSSWSARSGALHGTLSVRDGNGVMDCAQPLDVTGVSTSTGFTDSGVVSTIGDLGRYVQALASDALVRNGKQRWTNPLPASATTWFTAKGGAFQAGSLIGQYSAMPGYASAAYSDPGTGMTVAVVLNNSAGGATPANDLAWELAAIASKAPAAAGRTAPQFGLPWTAQQFHDAIAAAPVCPPAQ